MEISLIRHGKSMCLDNKPITCNEFNIWNRKYNDSGIFEENIYPATTINKILTSNVVVTSDLKRSIDSARLLNQNIELISDSLFRESELPHPTQNCLGLKLSPSVWAVMLRCLWFVGYSTGCESFVHAKHRAKRASESLIQYAREQETVALVGHGFMNMMIAKELQKLDWTGKSKASSKHWNCTTYSFKTDLVNRII